MPSNVNSNVEVRENRQTTDTPNLIAVLNKGESSSFLPELRFKMIKLLQESSNGSVIPLGAAAVDCSNAVEVSYTLNIASCSVEQLPSLDKMKNEPVALIKDRKISPLGENVLQSLKSESANDIGKVSLHGEIEKLVVGKMPHILASTKSKDKTPKIMASKLLLWCPDRKSVFGIAAEDDFLNIWDHEMVHIIRKLSYLWGTHDRILWQGWVGTATDVYVLNNFRGLFIYLMIIGDVVSGNGSESKSSGILVEWFGQGWWNSRAVAFLLTLVVVLLPLALLK